MNMTHSVMMINNFFIRLLECADPDLFNWLMNHGRPEDEALFRMIKLIQNRNKARGPVEM